MPKRLLLTLACMCAALPPAYGDTTALYKKYCADCHGEDRLGGMGPALLPQNLRRLPRGEAVEVILKGRAATQMPAFGDRLSRTQALALADHVYAPPARPPRWGAPEISASHIVHRDPATLPDRPLFRADPLNLFVVVEAGDHHVTILDGDTFIPLYRFRSRFALHGGPKYSPDGRFVYFASRDGWISKFDIYNLQLVAEIRAGINTRNAAVSSDGRHVIVGNYLPHTLVILDAVDLSLRKVIAVVDDEGKTSRVSAVYDAPPRQSFIVALKDMPEVWEIPYGEDREPIFPGLVHDYRLGEGLALKGPFPIRRIRLDDYLDDFFFDPAYEHLVGAARNGRNGQVINLIVGRRIATVDLPGLPHLGSGISWDYKGGPVLATPNLKEGAVSIIDMKNWKTIKRIDTLGPGFFIRSHENTPYAWVDVFFGPNRDAVHVIDKRSLKIVRTLRPSPGKTAAHVEFTRDGRYALLSIWDRDGELVVYDAASLKEVTRIPMSKPSGKYNVFNKIHRSRGTSH